VSIGMRGRTPRRLDRIEGELTRIKVRAGRGRVEQLLEWANGYTTRTWAVEGAGGVGDLLSQQLVAAGDTVLDVPATLASRVRVLGQSTKTDPNDARSVAALHASSRAVVRPADHVTGCRLPAKGHTDAARWATKLCCRRHALVGRTGARRDRQRSGRQPGTIPAQRRRL
jgi:transposase